MQVCSLGTALASVAPNQRLNTGIDFLRLLRSEGICPLGEGLSPAIMGGAPRDVFFSRANPNDIDIFFFANLNYQRASSTRVLNNLKEDLIVWLEDQNIEYESLLNEASSEYGNVNRFLDIISFNWRDTKIQVMIPSNRLHTSGDVFSLINSMPLFSAIAITQENLIISNVFLAAYKMSESNLYPFTSYKDVAYTRKKRPNGNLIHVASGDCLIYLAFGEDARSMHISPSDQRSPEMIYRSSNPVRRSTLHQREISRRFTDISPSFRDTSSVTSLNETL